MVVLNLTDMADADGVGLRDIWDPLSFTRLGLGQSQLI